MTQFYSSQNNWKTITYLIVRVGLGSYLLIHAIVNLVNYDEFIQLAVQYVPQGSELGFLANFTPIVPLLEFFIALMILTGLYARKSLIGAIVLGVFFTALFHYTGDIQTALTHSYTLILKVGLFYSLYYNKFSADYYNLWTTHQAIELEMKEKEEQDHKKKVMDSLLGL
ncbi:DoxX family protein [Nonlabens sp. Asnod2-A12]|uniref:DoxX family protein n=1 Tax=Nonlabens sp. Asnod2-A12 TaxID=3160578 RepID=UPI003862DAAD